MTDHIIRFPDSLLFRNYNCACGEFAGERDFPPSEHIPGGSVSDTLFFGPC